MFSELSYYQPADETLWQGRKDTAQPERFFEKILFPQEQTALITKEKKTLFLGFSSDAGVKRNGGREGAAAGPDQLKKQLAKLPCTIAGEFIDLGNIVCRDDHLEEAQKQFAKIIYFAHQQGHRTIALGGGHEIAWAHFQGLAPHYPKLGIINFDAHFDLRPLTKEQSGNSGTPFTQIAAWCAENKRRFNYCCLGIQQNGNTHTLFNRAHELNVQFLTAAELQEQSLAWNYAFLDEFMLHHDCLYLTLCLDVLGESFAPGVSAPQPLGVAPWQILPLLKYIIQSGKVVSLDIAELAPPLDQNDKTSRLAAQILAELLHTF
ncbi:MAG: formimidoylglutamase [Legionella sp. 40-6]|nr:formimidoylglutamase [Legionella sp.]OJY47196.1 MAG: formimidoylglutamase [Legionella sp. 40-6]